MNGEDKGPPNAATRKTVERQYKTEVHVCRRQLQAPSTAAALHYVLTYSMPSRPCVNCRHSLSNPLSPVENSSPSDLLWTLVPGARCAVLFMVTVSLSSLHHTHHSSSSSSSKHTGMSPEKQRETQRKSRNTHTSTHTKC